MLTSAPMIVTLSDLGHAWRHVATKYAGSLLLWHGDLADPQVQTRYQRLMRNGHMAVVTYRTPEAKDLVFAKIANGIDPLTAHQRTRNELRDAARVSLEMKQRYSKAGWRSRRWKDGGDR